MSPGSVQPHGALLAVDPHDLQILQAGGDTPRIFGAEPSDLLTTNLSDWFAPDRVSQVDNLFLDAEGPPMIRPVHAFAIAGSRDGGTVDTFVYRSGARGAGTGARGRKPPRRCFRSRAGHAVSRATRGCAPRILPRSR